MGSLAEAQRGLAARLVVAFWERRQRDCLFHGLLLWRVVVAEGTARFRSAALTQPTMAAPRGSAEAQLLEARVVALKRKLSLVEAARRGARWRGQLEAWGFCTWREHHQACRHEASCFVETLCEAARASAEPVSRPAGGFHRAAIKAHVLRWRAVSLTWAYGRWIETFDRTQAVQEIQARVLSLQLEKQTYVRLFTR